jgi:hypothetical protein
VEPVADIVGRIDAEFQAARSRFTAWQPVGA